MGDLPCFSRARFSFSCRSLSFLFLSWRRFSASFRSFFLSANLRFAARTSGSGGSEVYPWPRTPCKQGSD